MFERSRPTRSSQRGGPPLGVRDRRKSARYHAREGRAWVAWHEAHGPRTAAALLLDIGHGGAALVTDEAPPQGGEAWVRLAEDGESAWVEARVVAQTRSRRGPHLVRLAFDGTCPWDVLKSALFGVGSLDGWEAMEDPPEFADSRAWR
jgi:hypothetical protein